MIENYLPRVASIKKRVISACVDFTVFWIFIFILGYFFGESDRGKIDADGYIIQFGFTLTAPVSYLVLVIWALLFPIIEGLTGYTIGKRLLRIKVMKKNNTQVTILTSFIRHIVDVIDLCLFIGFIIANNNRYHQRIGDLLANTVVVNM